MKVMTYDITLVGVEKTRRGDDPFWHYLEVVR